MVTDLAEVARLGAERAAENLEFRRWLTAHHVPESEFQMIATEVESRIDCRICANCCRHSVVPVDESELESIAREVGSPVEQTRHRYTVADEEEPSRRVLRLTENGCVFLEGSLCLIYAARPRTCREFPHVHAGDHTLGARTESHGRWAALCPIIFNALEEQKRRRGFGAGR